MMRNIWLCLALLCTSTMQGQTTKEMRESLKAAMHELAFYPDSVDLMLKKASWNLQLGEWGYAKETYDKVLALQPANVAALYYRAYANEQLKRYGFARLDYENMLVLVPGNFEGQLGLALLNQKDSRYTLAMDQINGLITQYPDSAIAYAARAGMERERKMYDLAVYDYGEAIKRDSRNVDYRINRADLYLLLGKRREAREELDKLVRMGVPRPSLSDFYNRMKL